MVSVNPTENSPSQLPKENGLEGKKKTDFCIRSVECIKNILKYTGIIAAISAIASVIFLLKGENPRMRKLGDWTGNLYVIAEVVLVVSIIALIALTIFMKLH